MKFCAMLVLLPTCLWCADDDLRLRTVLPSPQTANPGLGATSLGPDAGGCAGQSGAASLFEAGRPRITTVDTPQISLSYSASATTFAPGRLITLILELEPKPRMHIYAPGAEHYTPIDWELADSKEWMTLPVKFPPSHMVSLPAVKETVPVFDGPIRLVRDVRISQAPEAGKPANSSTCLTIEGSFRYQACDDKECYFPKTVPLKWTFRKSDLEKDAPGK